MRILISLLTFQISIFFSLSETLPLWPAGNPGGWTVSGPEVSAEKNDGITRLKNISVPTLQSYAPIATGTPAPDGNPAVIICPGGGYNILAMNHEGWDVATYLADRGIHTFVLKYRLPREGDESRHAAALQDAQRALSLVRANAGRLKIDPARVGIMGFSAGGHLAAMASTTQERTYAPTDAADHLGHLPDFTALIYPAYLTSDQDTLAIPVPENTPPAFLVHAANDPVTPRSSLHYALALQAKKIPVELHIFAEGGHGYGILRAQDKPVSSWPHLLATWLKGF